MLHAYDVERVNTVRPARAPWVLSVHVHIMYSRYQRVLYLRNPMYNIATIAKLMKHRMGAVWRAVSVVSQIAPQYD